MKKERAIRTIYHGPCGYYDGSSTYYENSPFDMDYFDITKTEEGNFNVSWDVEVNVNGEWLLATYSMLTQKNLDILSENIVLVNTRERITFEIFDDGALDICRYWANNRLALYVENQEFEVAAEKRLQEEW